VNTRRSSFASDELLERLDGLLADLRALRAEVHELSPPGGQAESDNDRRPAGEKKTKPKKSKKSKKSKHNK
jgi:hypothetical protein